MPQASAAIRSLWFRSLTVALLCVLPAALFGQPSARVTSEIACNQDADCPRHDGLCFTPGLPTCGCDEGAGHCDANPLACDGANDCFGEEVCASGRCAEPGPREGTLCNFDEDCPGWMSCRGGGCTRGECTLNRDCGANEICSSNRCTLSPCDENRDCPNAFACRNRECQPVQCVADSDCGDARQVCRNGGCQVVECTGDNQCSGCEICNSQNQCQTRCDRGEGCQTLFTTELPFRVQRCANCTPDANGNCPQIQISCGRERRICDAIRDLERAFDRRRELPESPRPPGHQP
mgnify:CR=1 FL=1